MASYGHRYGGRYGGHEHDSGTGEFVSEEYAAEHPKTTERVAENVTIEGPTAQAGADSNTEEG
jgi:hypothetical protein